MRRYQILKVYLPQCHMKQSDRKNVFASSVAQIAPTRVRIAMDIDLTRFIIYGMAFYLGEIQLLPHLQKKVSVSRVYGLGYWPFSVRTFSLCGHRIVEKRAAARSNKIDAESDVSVGLITVQCWTLYSY